MSRGQSALDLIDLFADSGSFRSWDKPIDITDHSSEYQDELTRAVGLAGTDEAVLTGRAEVGGRSLAIVVSEFRFLGGTIGQAAADRIVDAVRRATAEGLPIFASTASGGTRMQEGAAAFVRMIDITRTLVAHKEAGLPYFVHQRHPTTGGVLASWGSLGHLTWAAPNALIGFLGPQVYEELEGKPFPSGIQTGENLLSHGIVDAVVASDQLRDLLATALELTSKEVHQRRLSRRTEQLDQIGSAWESIETTRSEGRVTVRDVLSYGCGPTVYFKGAGNDKSRGSIIAALTRIDGQPCVFVGQDRAKQRMSPIGPSALLEARGAIRLARELRLPLVTLVDTPGAELSKSAEEGALAGEIARCISDMSGMNVPTVSVILGQGSGGGAVALLNTDVVIATQNSWLSPLSPEGASAICFGDVTRAEEMAERQQVGAASLHQIGFVTALVPEFDDDDRRSLAKAVAAECAFQLGRLTEDQLVSR